jgi:GT2 family glycosyltransferase
MSSGQNIPTLAWTGERMIPGLCDTATELFHWQRYLYFRPWYQDAKVMDAASGEGYGIAFAANYAESSFGIDLSEEAINHAKTRYPKTKFDVQDVCEADYSQADLVVSFETIEHVPDPERLLRAFASCKGKIVISTPNRKTHSPGNKLEDKPLNPYHTIEWTPNEFAELVNKIYEGRQVRFLSQASRWPGLITEGLDDDAMYCIAVIGDGELPQWPSIGLSMPTVNNIQHGMETIVHLTRFYPGKLQFAVVANGSSLATLNEWRKFELTMPEIVKIISVEENQGYGIGSNIGFEYLSGLNLDIIGVTNDDVAAVPSTVVELVMAYKALESNGIKIGAVAPVTTNINGRQKVDIGTVSDSASLYFNAEQYHSQKHSTLTEVFQIRGMFMLFGRECLAEVGGFDPRFNIGNFEDDDHNLRCKLAGYSLWIAEGSYLWHHGSQTFGALMDNKSNKYNDCIERNKEIFQWKWDLATLEEWPQITEAPVGVQIRVPFDAKWEKSFPVKIDQYEFDLLSQASDIEFAQWMWDRMKNRPRTIRKDLVKLLMESAPHLQSAVIEENLQTAKAS